MQKLEENIRDIWAEEDRNKCVELFGLMANAFGLDLGL